MSSSDETLGVCAATPLLTLPGKVLNSASFNKAVCCWLIFATLAEAVGTLSGVSSWSSASLSVSELVACTCALAGGFVPLPHWEDAH